MSHGPFIRLNGFNVLPEHYERTKRLFAIAFGMTDVGVPKRKATRAAMEVAIDTLGVMMKGLQFLKVRS